jgi:hypothetical protein
MTLRQLRLATVSIQVGQPRLPRIIIKKIIDLLIMRQQLLKPLSTKEILVKIIVDLAVDWPQLPKNRQLLPDRS